MQCVGLNKGQEALFTGWTGSFLSCADCILSPSDAGFSLRHVGGKGLSLI